MNDLRKPLIYSIESSRWELPAVRWMVRSIGVVWIAQLAAMGLQLVYLAVVSRIVSPDAFASFAVAALVSTFGMVLLQVSLGRASARRLSEDVSGDRALMSVTVTLGLALGGAVALLSPVLAALWGLDEAGPAIALMGLQIPISGVSAVQVGVLRRLGRINAIALTQVVSVAAGVLVGIGVALAWPSAIALTIQPIVGVAVLSLAAGVLVGARSVPGKITRESAADLSFGMKAGYSGLLSYAFYGLPQWAMAVSLGPVAFANWNRAVTVGQVPIDQFSRSVATVAYSRFRSHTANERVRSRWTGMMLVSSWVVFPLLGATLIAVPSLVEIAIGPNWSEAQTMAPWVVAAAVLGLQGSLLANALESSGHFRSLWLGQYAAIPVLVLGAGLVILREQWLPAAAAFVVAAGLAHLLQVGSASRLKLIEASALARGYALASCLGALYLAECWLILILDPSEILIIVNAGVLLLLHLGLVHRYRTKLMDAFAIA